MGLIDNPENEPGVVRVVLVVVFVVQGMAFFSFCSSRGLPLLLLPLQPHLQKLRPGPPGPWGSFYGLSIQSCKDFAEKVGPGLIWKPSLLLCRGPLLH